MNATARKLILTALAVLATGSAVAGDRNDFFGRGPGPVAELSADERDWLRERWQRLPPDERIKLRKELRDNWFEVPPENRQQRRKELKDRLDDRRDDYDERDRRGSDDGYGRGYGSRHDDDDRGGRGRR
jgi:hypothetical protein